MSTSKIKGTSCVFMSLAGTREDDETVWNQIAYEGQWAGYSGGEFQFTREIFETIIANGNRRTDDIPIQFGHPQQGSPETVIYGAAGWISELRIDVDEEGRQALFARMKWSTRVASMIGRDEIRHCSVVVYFDGADPVTGEELGAQLIALGVVDAAFLDGMTRLAASRHGQTSNGRVALSKDTKMTEKELADKAMKALGDNFTSEKFTQLVEAYRVEEAILSGNDPKTDADAPAEDVAASQSDDDAEVVDLGLDGEPDGDETASPFASIAEQLGMDEASLAAVLSENLDALAALVNGTPDSGSAAEAALSQYASKKDSELAAVRVELASAKTEAVSKNTEVVALQFHVECLQALDKGVIHTDINDILELSKEAPDMARRKLAEKVKSPKVPLGRKYTPATPSENGVELSRKDQVGQLSMPAQHMYQAFKGAGHTHEDSMARALKASA